MKIISCLVLLFFIFFGTCVLAAPPTFGPPGIAPDPEGEPPVIGSATPNILGTWVGDGKDMQDIFDHGSIYKSSESYTVSLNVWAQEGPIFHAWAASMPPFKALPYPFSATCTTLAPISRAISTDPSVLPLSAMITSPSIPRWVMLSCAFAIQVLRISSSLRQGMMILNSSMASFR